MIRHATTALLAAAVVLAFAALAAVLLPADPAAAVQAPAVSAAAAVQVQEPAPAADPFLAALAPSSDFTPEQAAALSSAADRVCEGFTADVPVVVMEETLGAELHLTPAEAHSFVAAAAEARCFPSAA